MATTGITLTWAEQHSLHRSLLSYGTMHKCPWLNQIRPISTKHTIKKAVLHKYTQHQYKRTIRSLSQAALSVFAGRTRSLLTQSQTIRTIYNQIGNTAIDDTESYFSSELGSSSNLYVGSYQHLGSTPVCAATNLSSFLKKP